MERRSSATEGRRGSRRRDSISSLDGVLNLVRAPLKLHTAEKKNADAAKRESNNGRRSSVMGAGKQSRRRAAIAAQRFFQGSGARPRSTAGATLIAQRIRGHPLTLRQRLFLIFEEPSSGWSAYLFSLFVRLTTFGAALAATFQTVEWLQEDTGPEPWVLAYYAFNSLFCVELLLRIACYVPVFASVLDPFVWLDALAVMPFIIKLCFFTIGTPMDEQLYGTRVLDAFSTIRLFKLCRYHEGAGLLARALHRSIDQLLVPFFMLLLMVITCATCLYHIEWSSQVELCNQQWRAANVTSRFLRARPTGVQWGCEVCPKAERYVGSSSADGVDVADATDLCTTCTGYPPGAIECLGVPFGQKFLSIPHAAWFVLATVTLRNLPHCMPCASSLMISRARTHATAAGLCSRRSQRWAMAT